jgi:hypothetical protein
MPASIKLARKGIAKMQDVIKMKPGVRDEVLSATYSITTDPVLSKSAQKKKDVEAKKANAKGAAPGGLPAIKEETAEDIDGPVAMEE